MMDPHVDLIKWVVLIQASGIGTAIAASLTVVFFGIRKKADCSALDSYIKASEGNFTRMTSDHQQVAGRQVEVLQRVSTLEEQHKEHKESMARIEARLNEVDAKVGQIPAQVNGGILAAIREFREAIVSQMRINQGILVKQELAKEEEIARLQGEIE
jgi:hypothetical protein